MPFYSMRKQEKLAWAQPSVTRLNSFQPGEGFHLSDSRVQAELRSVQMCLQINQVETEQYKYGTCPTEMGMR